MFLAPPWLGVGLEPIEAGMSNLPLSPAFCARPVPAGVPGVFVFQLQKQSVTSVPAVYGAGSDDDESVDGGPVDVNQGAALSQDILSSAFVTSMFSLPSSSDEEDDHEDVDHAPKAPVAVPVASRPVLDLLEGLVDSSVALTLSAEYWAAFDVLGLLHVEGTTRSVHSSTPSAPLQTLGAGTVVGAAPGFLEGLSQTGYAVHPPHPAFAAALPALVRAISALTAAGWPPVFAFVFDELWAYVAEHVQPAMAAVLGASCLLEPSIYCWALGSGRAGESFTLPHRDYPYDEAMDSKGRPAIMNVWVPLTDATLDNGCMYLLPKEFDPLFDQPQHPNHLKCAVPGPGPDEFRCRMSLGGARPLPAPAGSVLCWNGNTVHWGSRCSKFVAQPRMSFSVAFRRKSALSSHLESSALRSMTVADVLRLTLPERVRLIAKGLLLFKWWFGVDKDILPPAFYTNVVAHE